MSSSSMSHSEIVGAHTHSLASTIKLIFLTKKFGWNKSISGYFWDKDFKSQFMVFSTCENVRENFETLRHRLHRNCRARRFQWRHAPRVLKLKPTFLQVLKTLYWLLNSKFMTEIANNWIISSQFFGQENTFYGAYEIMSVRSCHPRMTHWWRTHLFNTSISYKSLTTKSTEITLNYYFIVL